MVPQRQLLELRAGDLHHAPVANGTIDIAADGDAADLRARRLGPLPARGRDRRSGRPDHQRRVRRRLVRRGDLDRDAGRAGNRARQGNLRGRRDGQAARFRRALPANCWSRSAPTGCSPPSPPSVPEGGATIDIPVGGRLGRRRLCHRHALPAGRRAGKPHADARHRRQVADGRSGRQASSASRSSPPEKTEPRQPLSIPVAVTGAAPASDAYVTVAAVDVGILNLTRYEAPDPDDWYFGQRRLGLEIRDLYGRLIDGSLGATGTAAHRRRRRRHGRCRAARRPKSWSPSSPARCKLDADGKATVNFDIPQFNGTARVMAVAWTKDGVGHAATDVIIRDPVVVTASLPHFLAPGDAADDAARHRQHRCARPATTRSSIETTGDLVDRAARAQPDKLTLTGGKRQTLTVPLIGAGRRRRRPHHPRSPTPSGLSRRADRCRIPVRPPTLPVTDAHRGRSAAKAAACASTASCWPTSLLHGAYCQRQRLALRGLRHAVAADDARPLPLWLRRADDQPRAAAALCQRTGARAPAWPTIRSCASASRRRSTACSPTSPRPAASASGVRAPAISGSTPMSPTS